MSCCRRGSPTPSVASSQSISLSNSSLSAATKKQDSIQLTPSLSNYYHDKLIEHCVNLQADQAERQVSVLWLNYLKKCTFLVPF